MFLRKKNLTNPKQQQLKTEVIFTSNGSSAHIVYYIVKVVVFNLVCEKLVSEKRSQLYDESKFPVATQETIR